MAWYWQTLIGVGIALLLAWSALVILLLLVKPKGPLLREALRLLPDLLRLMRRLASDRTLPRGVRIRIGPIKTHWPGTDDGFAALCR